MTDEKPDPKPADAPDPAATFTVERETPGTLAEVFEEPAVKALRPALVTLLVLLPVAARAHVLIRAATDGSETWPATAFRRVSLIRSRYTVDMWGVSCPMM